MVTSPSNEQQFARVVADLSAEFASRIPPTDVVGVVDRVRAELEPPAKITEYLPVLVRRFAREELIADLKSRPLAG
ncbi:MAG: hypothetical protein JWP74_4040 [Marmoricola sp.]|nr:hypothetical protein [Marmoricola sp.]